MPLRNHLIVKRDRSFPYSKGMMAQSLMSSGLTPERAYRVARILGIELRRGERALVTTDELRERTLDLLAREEGAGAVERYRTWHELRHLERPLILLIGGAPGTGKSTVATEVAHRLGITRIVSSDVVRQVMRGIITPDVVPQIHTSSFAAASTIPAEIGGDPVIAGFLQQAETVHVGLRGVVDRAVQECFPLVLEGVHLVPGRCLVAAAASAIVVELILVVDEEEAHQRNFVLRADHTGDARPFERYLSAFPEIRRIQEHLVGQAARAAVPLVESSDIEVAVRRVMNLVLEGVVADRPTLRLASPAR